MPFQDNASLPSEIEYLLSLQAVRERAAKVFAAAQQGALVNFEYDASKMSTVSDFVIDVISRDFGPNKYDQIPPHGRWQHFNVGGVDRISDLVESWKREGHEAQEITRRLVDLFLVSVLLDAGAGDTWRFEEPSSGLYYTRSEGIAVASLYMFRAGTFSTQTGSHTVDGRGLQQLDETTFKHWFQISENNEMVGTASRVALLNNVGKSLLNLPQIYGSTGRPGKLVDYIIRESADPLEVDYSVLWSNLQRLMIGAWPKDRTRIDDYPLGDAWPLKVLELRDEEGGNPRLSNTIQPFHKLTQWLAYSLMVPFVRLMGCKWKNEHLGTGLPEYRNGGLFVDMEVLCLKDEVLRQGRATSNSGLPKFTATSDVIVEWRAMTVALLDELYGIVAAKFASEGHKLSMAQMLEAGTWKSGRELAATLRPATKSSPILIEGDGTLF